MAFRVPNQFRIRTGRLASTDAMDNCGAFWIPRLRLQPGAPFNVIASDGRDEYGDHGWEHVSVSLPERCPTWDEMSHVKRLFWSDDDCVMQLHPPSDQHVNLHPFCLHLWRPTATAIPMPPRWMVG